VKAGHLSTRVAVLVAGTAALAAALATIAGGSSLVVPEDLAQPTISGRAVEGATLTTSTGLWANSPTSYVYKWQRCGTDGTGCSSDVQTGPSRRYTLTSADVGRTIRVVVTASNADGRSDPAPSDATDVISSRRGPRNTAAPAISGDATEGQQLTVSPGTWAPATGVLFGYQWQRCDAANSNCRNVAGANGSSYTAGALDVGSQLRVLVRAQSASGRSYAYTDTTEYVQSNAPAPAVNQAPRLTFVSLVRIGRRVYARFRVCDDGLGRITVLERDTKVGTLAYARRFSVFTYASCGTFSRSWTPAPRFRTRGRTTVTLQAIDKSRKTSATRSRSVYRRF
jgi:hypothetical protein